MMNDKDEIHMDHGSGMGDELLNRLKKHYKDQRFTDFQIKLNNGVSISCHKIVLDCSSKYFAGLFAFGSMGSGDVQIKSSDMTAFDPGIMQKLCNYFYTGSLAIIWEDLEALAVAADFLQLEEILDDLDEITVSRIVPSNCVHLFKLGHMYNLRKVNLMAFEVLCNNFEEVCQSEEFNLLPYHALKKILESNMLDVNNEDAIFCACAKWCTSDDKREQYWEDLLKMIHVEDCLHHSVPKVLENLENKTGKKLNNPTLKKRSDSQSAGAICDGNSIETEPNCGGVEKETAHSEVANAASDQKEALQSNEAGLKDSDSNTADDPHTASADDTGMCSFDEGQENSKVHPKDEQHVEQTACPTNSDHEESKLDEIKEEIGGNLEPDMKSSEKKRIKGQTIRCLVEVEGNIVYISDKTKRQWKQLTDIPEAFKDIKYDVVFDDFNIYVVGVDEGYNPCSKYDMITDNWEHYSESPRKIIQTGNYCLGIASAGIFIIHSDIAFRYENNDDEFDDCRISNLTLDFLNIENSTWHDSWHDILDNHKLLSYNLSVSSSERVYFLSFKYQKCSGIWEGIFFQVNINGIMMPAGRRKLKYKVLPLPPEPFLEQNLNAMHIRGDYLYLISEAGYVGRFHMETHEWEICCMAPDSLTGEMITRYTSILDRFVCVLENEHSVLEALEFDFKNIEWTKNEVMNLPLEPFMNSNVWNRKVAFMLSVPKTNKQMK